MTGQMRAMGASCDWSREAFTLDEARNQAVVEAFRRLYDLGLIYRGHRIVNWDPKGQTTISDDEITYEERTSKLYTFRYSKDFPIPIATTRPETKVGDTAVAVHPGDARYAPYVGQTFNVTFCDVPLTIKVIADEAVDPAFGTGALGVTPAHSTIDWDMAQRHNLPISPVINEYARITVDGQLHDMKVTDARARVVAWITEQGLLENEEDTVQNVATAERTGGIVEPLPKLQWFIGVNRPFVLAHSEIDGIASGSTVTLKQLMRHVVESQQITMVPERYTDTYFHWIDNLRDWCISRQIWYGHRVPVWYKGEEITVSPSSPGDGWTQDDDTLDTWFSSGLWTFSTLGWPAKTPDLAQYHPTDVLETAYEILFFWVARMVLMSTSLVGQIPFRTVFLHGLVRDEKRQKLSKSKADSADPLDLIAQFGADALRMGLIFNTSPGTDSVLSEQKIRGMKHFGNKLWNIARYVLMNVPAQDIAVHMTTRPTPITEADTAILAQLDTAIRSITANLNRFALHEAAQEAYQFAWHEFADIYLEASKDQLTDETTTHSTRHILAWTLIAILKLLHPFTPFVTEALWMRIVPDANLLMVASWPKPADSVVQ
jgi:valyl-tRNA synthetase